MCIYMWIPLFLIYQIFFQDARLKSFGLRFFGGSTKWFARIKNVILMTYFWVLHRMRWQWINNCSDRSFCFAMSLWSSKKQLYLTMISYWIKNHVYIRVAPIVFNISDFFSGCKVEIFWSQIFFLGAHQNDWLGLKMWF